MDRKQYQQDVANVDAQFQPIFDSNAIDPEGLGDDGALPEISFTTPTATTMSAHDARELKTTIENQALANEMLELQGDGFDLRAPAPIDVAFERVGLNGKPITRAVTASETDLETVLSEAAQRMSGLFVRSLSTTPAPTPTGDRAFYQKLSERADAKSRAGRFVHAMAAGDRNAARRVIREVVQEDGIR